MSLSIERFTMVRIDLRRLSGLAAAAFLWSVWAATATAQNQIHPPGGGGATNPVVIAVLADRYTAAEQSEFDEEAANFFLSGVLQDDYFKTKASLMRVVTKFEGVANASAPSKYGFNLATTVGNCAVDFPTDTGPIWTAAAPLGAEYVVVIGNNPYTIGCTRGKIAYVSAGAAGVDVLEHEFGHMLASLWDQFGLPANGSTPFPDSIPASDRRNCWTHPGGAPPHWGSTSDPGCALYNVGIVRPKDMCRMGDGHHPDFCIVCKKYFDNWFADLERSIGGTIASHDTRTPQMGIVRVAFQPAPPKPPTTQPIVRLLLRFNPEKGTAEARQAFDSTGVYVPNYRRVGKYVYEILDNGKTVEFGVFSDQLFQARGYTGASAPHAAAPAAATEVIVQLPGETIARVGATSRNVSMAIWELQPAFTEASISRETFMRLTKDPKSMRQTQVISAADLRKVLAATGK